MPGKFITFEGGEGVGKTTQVNLLAKKLTDLGIKVRVTREPGGDEVGEKIRSVLKAPFSKKMDPLCEALLMFAARRDHFINFILPMLKLGFFVICDRFYDSTLVYQGLLKDVPFEDIMQLKYITIGNFEPDLTLILDMDTKTSLDRVMERNLIPDEYDLMNGEKHDTIRDGFRKIADIFSFRAVLVNATGAEKTVSSKIFNEVNDRLLKAAS